jgi:hypothetical protein
MNHACTEFHVWGYPTVAQKERKIAYQKQNSSHI